MPHFLHLGPARCATTWQARVYGQHPEIFIPESKDTEYFSHQYHRGETWYRAQFAGAKPEQVQGCICHRYFWHPLSPERAYQFNPQFKILLTLRDPWQRVISSYLYDRTLFLKRSVSLTEYLQSPVVAATIQYVANIQRWQNTFPAKQIHTTYYENLHQNPHQWLRPIWQFLGVSDYWRDDWNAPTWEGRTVRNEDLAHFAFGVSQILRRFGHYQIVGTTKSQGWVQRLLYISGREPLRLDPDDEVRARRIMQTPYDDWEKTFGSLPAGWVRP